MMKVVLGILGNFSVSVWDRGKQNFYADGSLCNGGQATPLQSVTSMALSAMVVECAGVIYFIENCAISIYIYICICTPE